MRSFIKFSNIKLEEFDRYVAILGATTSIIFVCCATYLNQYCYSLVGIFTLSACLFWLLIRKKASLNFIQIQSHSTYLLIISSFFCLYTSSLLSIYFRPNLYERPLIYFILTSLMVGVIDIELFFEKVNRQLVLFQIFSIGASISWSQLLIYPNLIAIDPYWHQMFTSILINLHHIPDGYSYSMLPMFQLYIALTSLITGLNYKFATMLSVSFLQILCTIILIYSFCTILYEDYKVGLLASLSVIVCNQQIFMCFCSIPNGFSTLLTLYILYIFLKLKTKFLLISKSLSIIFMFVLILTHTITSLFTAIVLFLYWFGYNLSTFISAVCQIFCKITNLIMLSNRKLDINRLISCIVHKNLTSNLQQIRDTVFIFKKVSSENFDNVEIKGLSRSSPIPLIYAILFAVSMFTHWIYSPVFEDIFGEIISSGFDQYAIVHPPPINLLSGSSVISLWEQIFNNIGTFSFFGLSFIGCFYMSSKKYRTCNTFNFAVIGLFPLFLGFSSLITKHSIIEHRWWYFAQLFLSIPFAVSILLITNSLKKNHLKPIFSSLLLIGVSFLLIMSPPANTDNHIFSPNSTTALSFTTSELQAANTVSRIYDGNMYTDDYSSDCYIYGYKFHPNDITFSAYLDMKNITALSKHLVLLRRDILDGKPFLVYSLPVQLNYDLRSLLNGQYFSKVYDCGSVEGYYE